MPCGRSSRVRTRCSLVGCCLCAVFVLQRGSFDISSEGTSPLSQVSATDEESDGPQAQSAAAAASEHRSARHSVKGGGSGRRAAAATQQQLERRLHDKESASVHSAHLLTARQSLSASHSLRFSLSLIQLPLLRVVPLCVVSRSLVEVQSRVRHLEQAAAMTTAQVAQERLEQSHRIQQLQDELEREKNRRAEQHKVSTSKRCALDCRAPSILSSHSVACVVLLRVCECDAQLVARVAAAEGQPQRSAHQ